MPEPVVISERECERLLRAGVVGRLGFVMPDGPMVLPLNYVVVGEAVVVRTDTAGVVATYAVGAAVAFEIDQIDGVDEVDGVDGEHARGWSVVAQGHAELVTAAADVELIERTGSPRTWAGGLRTQLVLIPRRRLTGRRLGAGWDPVSSPTVRQVLR